MALLCAVGLTSQTVQGWYTLVVLHAAAIPIALWCRRILSRNASYWSTATIATFLLVRLPLAAVLGLGHPMYQPPEKPLPLEQIRPHNIEDPALHPEPFGSREN